MRCSNTLAAANDPYYRLVSYKNGIIFVNGAHPKNRVWVDKAT